jgi:hypothetical protein
MPVGASDRPRQIDMFVAEVLSEQMSWRGWTKSMRFNPVAANVSGGKTS